jgi:hypothetical protein
MGRQKSTRRSRFHKPNTVAAALALLAAAVGSFGQQPAEATPGHERVEDRKVLVNSAPNQGADDNVVLILSRARVRAGVTDHKTCDASAKLALAENGAVTVAEALDQVRSIAPNLRWRADGSGSIRVDVNGTSPEILRTRFSRLTLDDSANLILSASQLAGSPELSSAATAMGLEVEGPEIGFSSLQKSGPPPIPNPKPTDVSGLTLEEALDLLARLHGTAVWELSVRSCGGRNVLRIDWRSK